jgi:hypothetical protein
MTATNITSPQDLIDALLQIREEREDLEAREEFIKQQLQGAMALGELDCNQLEDGVYQFSNAKYSRVQRETYKYSKQALKAMNAIKEQDIDSGLAKRNVTVFWRLNSAL